MNTKSLKTIEKVVAVLCATVIILLAVLALIIYSRNLNRYHLEKQIAVSGDIKIDDQTKEIIYTPADSRSFKISDIIKLIANDKNIKLNGVDRIINLSPDFSSTNFDVSYKNKKIVATYKLKINYTNILFIYSENRYLGCVVKNVFSSKENKVKFINDNFIVDIDPLFFSDKEYTNLIDVDNEDVIKEQEKIYVMDRREHDGEYCINFLDNNNNLVNKKYYKGRTKIIRPADDFIPGYKVANWYRDKEKSQVFDFSNIVSNLDINIYGDFVKTAVKLNLYLGDSIYQVITGEERSIISLPDLNDRVTQDVRIHFTGWYNNISNGEIFNESLMPSEDMDLYAHFIDRYKINLWNNGDLLITKYVTPGDSIVLNKLIDNGTNEFKGWIWYNYEGLPVPTIFTPDKDTELHARWLNPGYLIEYYFENVEDEGYSLYDSTHINAMVNDVVELQEADKKVFDNMILDLTHPETKIGALTVSDNIFNNRFKLFYKRNIIKVTFDLQGGSGLDPLLYQIKSGATITKPQNHPSKDGYVFKYYTLSSANQFEFDFKTPLNQDTVIYAIWGAENNTNVKDVKIEHYVETFNDSEYELYKTEHISLEINSSYEAKPLEIVGFTYNASKSDKSIVVLQDSILKIYYTRNIYTISFDTQGGLPNIDDMNVKYNDIVREPNVTLVKPGKMFAFWSLTAEETISTYDFNSKVKTNFTLYAHYTEKEVYQCTINYYIKGTTIPVPGVESPIMRNGYVNEFIEISHPMVVGYVVTDGMPILINLNVPNKVVNIYYEVDNSQTFTHTINYYLSGTTNLVPGIERNSDMVTGAIGYSKTVTYPTAPSGYKLVDTNITSETVTIVNGFNTSSIVYYEIDVTQNTFIGKINYYLKGTTNKVPGITPNPDSVTGYIDQVVNVIAPVAPSGYKESAGNPTTITIKGNNSAVVNIYYEVDNSQTFTHTINYYLNGTTNLVPGIERNSDMVTGAIGYSKTIIYPTAPSGYKLVDTNITSETVTIVNGFNTSSTVYYEPLPPKEIRKVLTRGYHTVILTEDGSVYMCGQNNYGQLGLGDNIDRDVPTLLPSSSYGNEKIYDVYLGEYHTAILTENRSLYMCGQNNCGQLGLGDNIDRDVPTLLPSSYYSGQIIDKVFMGVYNTAILTENRDLFTWGYGESGQLCVGSLSNRNIPTFVPHARYGYKIIKEVSLGLSHTAILTTDDLIYMCGSNFLGELGINNNSNQILPVLIPSIDYDYKQIKKVSLGHNTTAILAEDGSLYVCGLNSRGQLGLGDTANRQTLTLLPSSSYGNKRIKDVSLGYNTTAILTEDGSLYVCGQNDYGQLGLGVGDTYDHNVPILLSVLNYGNMRVKEISIGAYHSIILTTENSIYVWGVNHGGQLGLGDKVNRTIPTLLSPIV